MSFIDKHVHPVLHNAVGGLLVIGTVAFFGVVAVFASWLFLRLSWAWLSVMLLVLSLCLNILLFSRAKKLRSTSQIYNERVKGLEATIGSNDEKYASELASKDSKIVELKARIGRRDAELAAKKHEVNELRGQLDHSGQLTQADFQSKIGGRFKFTPQSRHRLRQNEEWTNRDYIWALNSVDERGCHFQGFSTNISFTLPFDRVKEQLAEDLRFGREIKQERWLLNCRIYVLGDRLQLQPLPLVGTATVEEAPIFD
jgi:hypothetical protein